MQEIPITQEEALEYIALNQEFNDLKKRVEAKKEFIKQTMLNNGLTKLKFPNGVALSLNNKYTRDWVPNFDDPNSDPFIIYIANMGCSNVAYKIIIDKDAIEALIKSGKLDKTTMDMFKQITKTTTELRAAKA